MAFEKFLHHPRPRSTTGSKAGVLETHFSSKRRRKQLPPRCTVSRSATLSPALDCRGSMDRTGALCQQRLSCTVRFRQTGLGLAQLRSGNSEEASFRSVFGCKNVSSTLVLLLVALWGFRTVEMPKSGISSFCSEILQIWWRFVYIVR